LSTLIFVKDKEDIPKLPFFPTEHHPTTGRLAGCGNPGTKWDPGIWPAPYNPNLFPRYPDLFPYCFSM